MTTIQDKINKQIDKITFEMDCSEGESNVWNKKLKELFSESIKEVEEETRKETKQEIAELKIKVRDLTNHCKNL